MTPDHRIDGATDDTRPNPPLVLVAKWGLEPEDVDPAARALLGIRTGPVATIYRLDPDTRTIRDTRDVLRRGGYDTGLYPTRAGTPDHAELVPNRITRAKSFLQDLFAEAFLSGGCRARGSDRHAAGIEMSDVPTTDPADLEAIVTEVLSAPILDAAATSRLAITMAAIAASSGAIEDPDVCAAPMPWRDGHVSRSAAWKPGHPYPTAPIDPTMDALLPRVVNVSQANREGRPKLVLSPFMMTLHPSTMPDPITTIRVIERLRREPIA
jgi:hypothetical protein